MIFVAVFLLLTSFSYKHTINFFNANNQPQIIQYVWSYSKNGSSCLRDL